MLQYLNPNIETQRRQKIFCTKKSSRVSRGEPKQISFLIFSLKSFSWNWSYRDKFMVPVGLSPLHTQYLPQFHGDSRMFRFSVDVSKSQNPIVTGAGSLWYRGIQWTIVGQSCTEDPDWSVQDNNPLSEALAV